MAIDPASPFSERLHALPWLGLGISTEFGAGAAGLDLLALRRQRPDLVEFLEIGIDLARGLDAVARAWIAAGFPRTFHFLDVNLEERESLDDGWLAATGTLAREIGAAWLCGDAGLWHVGPRDRGHGTLLPPVLSNESAAEMSENVRRLRESTGFEVLPENPPAHVYLGPLHLLDYFARVSEAADCGLLLDVAHLAIYQRACGHGPLTGLDGFPLERVVEIHVAGATEFASGGRLFVDDDHSPAPLDDTWKILEAVLPRASALRALVFECERNAVAQVVPVFERLRGMLAPGLAPIRNGLGRTVVHRIGPERVGTDAAAMDHRTLQRTLFRMQNDADFDARLRRTEPTAVASTGLDVAELAPLRATDPAAVAADRDGARRRQLLRNVSTEFAASVRIGPGAIGLDDEIGVVSGPGELGAAPGDHDDPDWVEAFLGSHHFHHAIANDGRLPLAFARHAEDTARGSRRPAFRALVALEVALAHARRRTPDASRALPEGSLLRAPEASLLELPRDTHALAEGIRSGAPHPAFAPSSETETLLVFSPSPTVPTASGELRTLRVEPLPPLVARFLQAASHPLAAAACARFAATHGIAPADLEAVVADFVADGVLLRGRMR